MEWIKSASFTKPSITDDTLSKQYVYIRRNITEKVVEINGITTTYYEYEETLMLKADYYALDACISVPEEHIGETEDAICELSEIMEEQIASLEDAICELSEEMEGEE